MEAYDTTNFRSPSLAGSDRDLPMHTLKAVATKSRYDLGCDYISWCDAVSIFELRRSNFFYSHVVILLGRSFYFL